MVAAQKRFLAESAGDGAERIEAYAVRPVTFVARLEGCLSAAGRDVSAEIPSFTSRFVVEDSPGCCKAAAGVAWCRDYPENGTTRVFFGAPGF